MQYRSKKRDIHGVILLDKPAGMSSNKALQRVKSRFQARKAGHTGSLDPLATGLLPICFGQATKVCEYFLHSHKRYSTVIKLGVITDTWDADGDVLETRAVTVSDDALQASLDAFRGEIQQVPPMFSALKKNGQPLYKLARQGEEVERMPRNMTVYDLQAERLEHDLVQLNVHCSSGFYIRSLAYDLGQALGCGAHVTALRRTESKGISVSAALSLEAIEQAELADILLPIDTLLQDFPSVVLSSAQIDGLRQGRPTPAGELSATGLSRFMTADGELFAVGEVLHSGLLKTHKMFVYD